MSKNVLSNGPQTPIPDTSRRAFSALFPFLIKLLSSGMSSGSIAVITVEPANKISFVYNCMHTKLRVNTMGNDPLASFMCQDRW